MARAQTDDHSHAALEAELAALKKEVASLRAQLAKAPKGSRGSDPRVDLLVEYKKLEVQPGPESKARRKAILAKL
jgi:hypothetical protein